MQVLRDVRRRFVEAGRHHAASQRELVKLAVELDESRAWALDGVPTCAHWIADALDVEVCTAREWIRIGRKLHAIPEIDEAWGADRISYSKVRALSRVASPERAKELCEIAERTPAGRLSRALAAWLARRETPEETEQRQNDARSLTVQVEPDGMMVGTFRVPPLAGASLMAAVDHRLMTTRRRDDAIAERGIDASADALNARKVTWPSIAQQRADVLVDLVVNGGGSVKTEVVVHVRADGCSLDDGTPIAGSIVERIAPASFLRVLIHDAERRPVNASGRQRHPTARQRRVVKERDGAVCVDCGSSELLQFDHIPDFEESLHTLVNELELRCWTCHRARHR